jgi:antitoxin component YwqK of YwqJK toxin-antitoxin module
MGEENKDFVRVEDGEFRHNGSYFFVNGEPYTGEVRTFYENGKVQSIVNYVDGKAEGEAKTFHETGVLKVVETYKHDELVSKKA